MPYRWSHHSDPPFIKHQNDYNHRFSRENTLRLQVSKFVGDELQLLVCNVYVPPVISCIKKYTPDFSSLFNYNDVLIVEDFNAQDTTWHSSSCDEQAVVHGAKIVKVLEKTTHRETSKRHNVLPGPKNNKFTTWNQCQLAPKKPP